MDAGKPALRSLHILHVLAVLKGLSHQSLRFIFCFVFEGLGRAGVTPDQKHKRNTMPTPAMSPFSNAQQDEVDRKAPPENEVKEKRDSKVAFLSQK